jgi:hypothetical protein
MWIICNIYEQNQNTADISISDIYDSVSIADTNFN